VSNIIIETHSDVSRLSFIKAVAEHGFDVEVLRADDRCPLLLGRRRVG
jgi:hypothetical protein